MSWLLTESVPPHRDSTLTDDGQVNHSFLVVSKVARIDNSACLGLIALLHMHRFGSVKAA
jgi:hypothetical protein